ncbi:zinc transporter ZIP4-like isoform X2 [Syngnathoides biaculeatus]|uniref:zinc transporter ZIP4-like isoform X2 n=1 Tax=Syngnathoides biaculeatus TaxID=300417 RepID=UPI002ADDE118|nr:zinc transporter ZIP4-like isoform X2 [Syngnathoides biaculeatus]
MCTRVRRGPQVSAVHKPLMVRTSQPITIQRILILKSDKGRQRRLFDSGLVESSNRTGSAATCPLQSQTEPSLEAKMKKFGPALRVLWALTSWCALGCASACPAVEEAFGAVAGLLLPDQQRQHLGEGSLVTLFNTLENRVQCGEVPCGKCNLTDSVHQLINNHSDHRRGSDEEQHGVDVSGFTTLAAGCVLYLSSPDTMCTAAAQGRWGQEVEHFLDGIASGNSHEHHHEEEEAEEGDPCHGREHRHVGLHGLESALSELLKHYESSGNESCVTASDIMLEVGAPSAEQTQAAGAVLGRVLYHALRGRCFRSLPEESFFLDYIMHQLGSENITIKDLEALMKSLDVGPSLESSHGNEEDEHAHHDHDHDSRHRHLEANSTWEEHCFAAHELVLIHGVGGTSPTLGRSDLARLSPALIQQILSGACSGSSPAKPDKLSKTERYLYATLANVVITLMSMVGILLLLCTSCTSVFQLCIQFCVSLAVGSLSGDALLHLLPMFLGLHVHSDEAGGSGLTHHYHGHQEPGVSDYVYKMLVVMAGIYYFYLMETIFNIITHRHRPQADKDKSEDRHCDHGHVLEMYQQEKKQKYELRSTSKVDLVKEEEEHDSDIPSSRGRTREQRLLPFMITLGDGIHNFADGLAMGAAFSLSWKSGLATSLAVFCHELPHELGDFAILLHSGLSVRQALLLNLATAMTSFMGLYIGLGVATDLATTQWIAALTAGLFLYVGLADMLPTMIHIDSKRPWLMFALQNVGLLSGWGILLLLSLFEESISF